MESPKILSVHSKEILEICDSAGRVTMIEGPCITSVIQSKVHRLRKFVVVSPKYIIVRYSNGENFHIEEFLSNSLNPKDGHHIDLKEGNIAHGVSCHHGYLSIEPDGKVAYLKVIDGNFIQYIPPGKEDISINVIPTTSAYDEPFSLKKNHEFFLQAIMVPSAKIRKDASRNSPSTPLWDSKILSFNSDDHMEDDLCRSYSPRYSYMSSASVDMHMRSPSTSSVYERLGGNASSPSPLSPSDYGECQHLPMKKLIKRRQEFPRELFTPIGVQPTGNEEHVNKRLKGTVG